MNRTALQKAPLFPSPTAGTLIVRVIIQAGESEERSRLSARLATRAADVNTLERQPATELKLNEIGAVVIDTHLPLFVDQYLRNRATGSFVLIDPISNATVAAGMVTGRDPRVADVIAGRESEGIEFNRVSAEERSRRVDHVPALVWLNGDANLAYAVERELFSRGYLAHVIAAQSEGSVLLEVAQNTLAAGLVTICSADFLYEVERERAQSLIEGERFVEVDVSRFDDTGDVAHEVARILVQRSIFPPVSPGKETPRTTGCTLWFTGMSGAGKSTLGNLVAQRLREAGARIEVLDGDVVRTQLCKDLGFSRADREENIRRIGFLCELLSRNGVIATVAAISPYRASRQGVRGRVQDFIEIYMHCPMEVLIQRDVKGLYRKALAGEIRTSPEFPIRTSRRWIPRSPSILQTRRLNRGSLRFSICSKDEGSCGPNRRLWPTLQRVCEPANGCMDNRNCHRADLGNARRAERV